MQSPAELTKLQIARFLAAKSIAAASAFIDGRSDAAQLARDADQLCGELMLVADDPDCSMLADTTGLLVASMMRSAVAVGPRLLRWRAIMAALLDLVRLEATSQKWRRRGARAE